MRTYVDPIDIDIDKDEFRRIVEYGKVELKCDAIVRAAHSISDYDWLVSEFRNLLNCKNVQVRGVSVTCLGHLARLNENADKQQLLHILEPLLLDPEIGGRVEDAIEDIKIFG